MLHAKKRGSKNDGRKRRKTAASAAAVEEVSVGGATSQQQGHQQQTKTSSYNSAQIRAAKVIGSAWKKCFASQTTLRLIGKFKDAKLMSSDIQGMSFETMVSHLRESEVISAAKACLQRVHFMSNSLHGLPEGMLNHDNVNVRTFLAAFLIVHRPNHVFEMMGERETTLKESATVMLRSFENILVKIQEKCSRATATATTSMMMAATSGVSHPSPGDDNRQIISKDFIPSLFRYLTDFKRWKVQDEANLIRRIMRALVALYEAEAQLPLDEPEDSSVKKEFRTQVERLRSKMLQVGGQEKLDEFDRNRRENLATATAATLSSYRNNNPHIIIDESSAFEFPSRMTNEQLAHELLLDPTFQLDVDAASGVVSPEALRIREVFHDAFWASLEDDLRDNQPPCYGRALRVLAEIRDGIAELASAPQALAIREIVDVDHIKAQLRSDAYDWASCTATIQGIFRVARQVQAPSRDSRNSFIMEEVTGKMTEAAARVELQPAAFCFGLHQLLDVVNAMRVDAANARLRLIAPVVVDHGVEYERGKFAEKLESGAVTVVKIKAAIEKSVDSMISKMSSSTEEVNGSGGSSSTRASDLKVLCHANIFCDLMMGPAINANNILETLLLDKNRLIRFWNGMRYMATILSILNQLKHHHSTTAAAAAAAVKSNGITTTATTSPSSSAAEFAKLIDPVISHIFVFHCADATTATTTTTTSTTINSASYYKFDDAKKESLLDSIVDAFQLRDVGQRDAVIKRVKSAFDWKNDAVTSLM